ncbi:MAG: PKD domain-containing protein [Bacteroidetes bacterium]|nr:PKD domain-containing protein [Bacteroidota bacterium]
MLKKYTLILLLSFPFLLQGQTVIWAEDFNNGCTDNCGADGYTSTNGTWTVVDMAAPGDVANEWFVSCAENGEPIGSCGAGCGNNATLHVGSVPCSICITCPSGDCGAAYNAGPSSITGEDPTTNKRVISPLINTVGKTNISLHFKYIELGNNALDDAMVEFSVDGGASWLGYTNTPKTPFTCPGQGFWTSFSSILPSICENIPNLRLAFRWINNDDGVGNDPSFAVDDIELSVPSAALPTAAFTISTPTPDCDTTCVGLTNSSTGNPTSWTWTCPAAINSPQSSSAPQPFCFTTSGTFPITLTVSNTNGSNSLTQNVSVTVSPSPQPAFSTSDALLCRGECTGFSNLTSGTINSVSWNFTGGTPSSSTSSNPSSVCYAAAGSYAVTLTVNNGTCSASVTQNSFITVNAATVPTVTVNGSILTSTSAQSYQWYSVQNGLISGATQITYTASQAGNYYVIITDVNGCTAQSATVNLIAPVASFSVTSTSPGCTTTCVEFTDNSTGNPTQWSWSCPGAINPLQTGISPVQFCFASSGSYTTTLTVSNALGSSTFSQTLNVNLLPTPVINFSANDAQLCAGECTGFTNLTPGTIATSNWSFQGGNPSTSSSTNPTSICFANSGSYSVTLTVSNGSCTSTQTNSNFITVNSASVPVITINGSLLTSSPAQSYQWYSVQNGIIAGATLSTYTASPGQDYYVVITDLNGCTAQSSTVNIAGPSAGFSTAGNNPGCDTSCVSLTDNSSGNPTSWSWSCPGAVNPNQTGPTPAAFCFTTSGTYTVTLTVSNAIGSNTFSQALTVTMLPVPVVAFSANDVMLCTGECIGFTNQTSGMINSSSWSFQGAIPSTSNVLNPGSICYANSGTYEVSLTVSNGSCSSTQTISNYITVNSVSVPVITINGNLLTSSPAQSYQWYSVQNGLIAGATLSTYTASPGEDYYVVITDLNGCTAQSATVNLAGPSAAFSTASINPGCDTSCVALSDNSSGNPVQWTWTCQGAVNPVQSGSIPLPFCFTQSGSYPVTLIVSNGGGTDSITQTIVVNMLPSPDVFFTSSDSILCTGECTSFSNITAGTVASSNWFFSGGTPSASTDVNPTNICYSNAGVFPVTLTVSNGTCVKTRSIVNYVTVHSPPVPTISANGNVLTSTTALSYQWYSVQSGLIAGANLISYTVITTGEYYVVITDQNGCTSESAQIHVDVDGIEDIGQTIFTLFPNPVRSELKIISKKAIAGNIKLELFSISGKRVLSLKYRNKQEFSIDLSELPAGLYTLKIQSSESESAYKVVKLDD